MPVGCVDGLIGLDGAAFEASERSPYLIEFVVDAFGEGRGIRFWAGSQIEAGCKEQVRAGGLLCFHVA